MGPRRDSLVLMVVPLLAAIQPIAAIQHGVVARRQLTAEGLTRAQTRHGVASGRLHSVCTDVFAVGRRELTVRGCWMAAVLACGDGAALSHLSAAELWELRSARGGPVYVSVPYPADPRRAGVTVHRRRDLERHVVTRDGIPVTDPALTLVDLAAQLPAAASEAAIKEADVRDLVDPEELRRRLAAHRHRAGTARLRALLDRRTFRLTDSALERRFLGLCRHASLPLPETGWEIGRMPVDFFWPSLGLVVETDGLRYHRTPTQQTRDRLRDQHHTAAGLTPLRFTHEQIEFRPAQVAATLAAVMRRLPHRDHRLSDGGHPSGQIHSTEWTVCRRRNR